MIIYRTFAYEGPPYRADARVLAGQVFCNLWGQERFPYKTIDEGDTVFLIDHDEPRVLGAELRVARGTLLRHHYRSLSDGIEALRAVYGVDHYADTSAPYTPKDAGPGFLLAFAVDVIAPLNVPFDYDLSRLGARGYLAVNTFARSDKIDANARDATVASLPPPGREPIAHAPGYDLGLLGAPPTLMRAPRAPALAVKVEVLRRSGGRCEEPLCGDPGTEFDHIVPWSRGGNSDLPNIRLLCSFHNGSKGNKMPPNPRPDQWWIELCAAGPVPGKLVLTEDLEGLEVRTDNSIWFSVRDRSQSIVLTWNPRRREVAVSADPGGDLVRPWDGKRRTLWMVPPPRGGRHPGTTSRVRSQKEADPHDLLASLGLKTGHPVHIQSEW